MPNVDLEITNAESIVVGGVAAYSNELACIDEVDVGTLALFVVEQTDETATPSFLYVASAADLEDLPEEPDFENDVTIFRTDKVEVITNDPATMDEFVDSCTRRIEALMVALQSLSSYSSTQVVNISA